MTLCPKLSIDMAIQSQALSVHVYPIMRKREAPICKLSRSKAPKIEQICHYRHARKTSGPFILYETGVNFSSRNNSANLGYFVLFSV